MPRAFLLAFSGLLLAAGAADEGPADECLAGANGCGEASVEAAEDAAADAVRVQLLQTRLAHPRARMPARGLSLEQAPAEAAAGAASDVLAGENSSLGANATLIATLKASLGVNATPKASLDANATPRTTPSSLTAEAPAAAALRGAPPRGGAENATSLAEARAHANATEAGARAARSSATCWRSTGGTCITGGCDMSRGATRCENFLCVCDEGFCANNGRCEFNMMGAAAGFGAGGSSDGQWTGGTCVTTACDAWRGETVCSIETEFRCMCTSGQIVKDGKCMPAWLGGMFR